MRKVEGTPVRKASSLLLLQVVTGVQHAGKATLGTQTNAQVDLIQRRQKLLQPHHTLGSLATQINPLHPLPIRLERLHVRNVLQKSIGRDAKGALGQEGGVGVSRSAEGARLGL